MAFRILCILSITVALGHSQKCTYKYDYKKCGYNMFCTDQLDTSYNWQSFQRNTYNYRLSEAPHTIDDTQCSIHITYSGYVMEPLFLVYKRTLPDISGSVPPTVHNGYNTGDGKIHIIYSLDLSDNNYDNTPVISKMNNLVILNLSRNNLKTAVLSNQNELNKLKELDLSYNTISDINYNSYEHPYSTLTNINISHNYLVKIPDAVFDKIDNLQTLDLSYNYIEGLSPFTFEGSRNLLHLNLSNNRLTDINSSLFRFTELVTLHLSNNKIKKLKFSDFEKLNKLEVLDLSSNSIKTLDNVFQNMALLYSLDLNNNILEAVNKDTFVNLQSLTRIDLSKNKLKTLPKDLFKNKTINRFFIDENFIEGSLAKGTFEGINVTSLDLSFQQLTAIEDYAFNDMINLDTLSLNNNGIYLLSNMCFKTLTSLQVLDLSNNKIASLDFDKSDLSYLQSLFLRNNRLTDIKHEHFQNLDSLVFVEISGNAISQLEPHSFKSLSSLISLEISNNPLTGTLKTDTFDGLVSLPNLDLSRNLLTTVQNASFNEMNELKNLNMSRSKIKELQFNVFANTGYIETLDLSFNKLENFFVNTTDLIGLSTLLLNNNLIKVITSTTLHEMPRLTNLNLGHNLIENIRNDSFNTLSDLRSLDLSYNVKLEFTQNLIRKTENLHTLILSGIKTNIRFGYVAQSTISEVSISDAGLQKISALNLTTLPNLVDLSLRNNNVSRLEIGDFSGIDKLVHLDLSWNQISFIQPGVFKDNRLLTSLNISHNCLSFIGYGIFRGLFYLNTLDMSYNKIKDLHSERFYEVQSLSQLIVDHNEIESINAEEFSSLSWLSIGDNPLSCRLLVKLKKQGVPFEITAIKKDEHNGENIDGVTCNRDQRRSMFEPTTKINNSSEQNEILVDVRNILYNMSIKNSVHDSNDKYLENLTNVIEKSNIANNENVANLANLTSKVINLNNVTNENVAHLGNLTSRVIDLNNVTNILLLKLLNSLHENAAATVSSVPFVSKGPLVSTTLTPLLDVNGSVNPFGIKDTVDLIPYIDKIKKDLEKTIAEEKQNVMKEIENKFSLVNYYHTESLTTSPKNAKSVSNIEETKSIFTEVCVAMILLILVGMCLYKFYKSRMCVRKRMSYSTRELPGAMDNSTL